MIIPNTKFSNKARFSDDKFSTNTYENMNNLTPSSEINTGKIFNNKPVYRQNFSGAVSADGNLVAGGIDDIVSIYGNVEDASGHKYLMSNTSFYVEVNDENVLVLTVDVSVAGNPYNFTVEYTKV